MHSQTFSKFLHLQPRLGASLYRPEDHNLGEYK